MNSSRRDFIKFIVAGSVATGCPVDLGLLAAPIDPEVDGEHKNLCHKVRDGHAFPRPAASERHEIVIVGGGISGLTAAYLLRGRDFLLLEKECHWGGNAYLQEYDGMAFATGSAFTAKSERHVMELVKELQLPILPIDSQDGTIINREFVADTWRAGIDHLPYPTEVRESFKKFRRDVFALPFHGRGMEFDQQPFSKYLQGYAAEVKIWWDAYGASNWGASSEETSAMVGVSELKRLGGEGPDERVTWPGGLGAISQRLVVLLEAQHRERMISQATIVAVEHERTGVQVTYVDGQGVVRAVVGKAAILATPKFITRRLVVGLPAAQDAAMFKLRYIPYPVVNLIFDRPVFNEGYDTWCPGNTFTDFVVADWPLRHQPGYRQKNNILTFYTPLRETERTTLLTEDASRQLAARVLRDFQELFPGSNVDPIEVHIYRRGHPLYMSTPGNFTQVQPLVRAPMERIFFANTDSEGPVSSTSEGIAAAHRAVHELQKVLGQK